MTIDGDTVALPKATLRQNADGNLGPICFQQSLAGEFELLLVETQAAAGRDVAPVFSECLLAQALCEAPCLRVNTA